MEIITKKWIERSKYDLDTAKVMFKGGRYLYVAFMCQQALEKLLKAVIIANKKEILRIHNLVRLAEIAGVYQLMHKEYQNFLADLTPFAIEARYGDYKDKLSEIINKKTADIYFNRAKKVYAWIRKRLVK